jgi:hypothetical protein
MDVAAVSKEMLRWMTLHEKAEVLACVATRRRCVTEAVLSAHMNASREAQPQCAVHTWIAPRTL